MVPVLLNARGRPFSEKGAPSLEPSRKPRREARAPLPPVPEPARSGILTEEERLRARQVVAHGIQGTTETGLGLHKAECLWRGFLIKNGWEGDLFMARDPPGTQAEKLIKFYLSLQLDKIPVKRTHKALVHVFRRDVLASTAVFGHASVQSFLKGADRHLVDLRAVQQQRFGRRKVALLIDWVRQGRSKFFKVPSLVKSDVESSLCYLAMALQVHTGCRISNLAHTGPDRESRLYPTESMDPNDKHALRGQDVLFCANATLGPNVATRNTRLDTISPSNEWTKSGDTVFAICFLMWTKKNQGYHVEPLWVRRGMSEDEDQFLEDLVLSRESAPMAPDSLFFSKVDAASGATKRITSKMVNNTVKALATSMGAGAPNFSTTSGRSAGISALARVGLSEEQLRKHAGHKSSKTTFAHYVFKGVPRRRIPSALSLTPEQGLDEEDLRLLLMSMKEVRRQLGL